MENLSSEKRHHLVRWGAISLIGMALCYIGLFIIYGAVLSPPDSNDISEKIAYFLEHKMLIKFGYIFGYVLFSCFLCLAVQAIYALYGRQSPVLINTASLFGLFWALVVLCTGMIGITSMEFIATMHTKDQTAAEIIYHASSLMETSLGGGIEVLGGLWVFLIGIAGWRYKLFSNAFTFFTLLKGAVGVLSLFISAELLLITFGLTGIVWFVWLGVILLQNGKYEDKGMLAT